MKAFKIILIVLIVLGLAFLGATPFIIKNKDLISKKLGINKKTACQYANDKFIWGVGINAYDLSVSESPDVEKAKTLIDLAAEVGANTIRFSIPDWAYNRQEKLIVPLTQYAKQKNLDVALIIEEKKDSLGQNKDENYNKGLEIGKAVAPLYKDSVCYYQISNELSGKFGKTGTSGKTLEEIDTEKYNINMPWIEGVIDGLNQSGESGKQKILTGHWVGVGSFDMINDSDNKDIYNIIGWNWLNNSLKLDDIGDEHFNLPQKLNEYNKKVWITEAGMADIKTASEKQFADYIYDFAKQTRESKYFSGFFPFQIIDIPSAKKDGTIAEANGLVNIERADNSWKIGEKKEAFYSYQKIIQEYKGD